MNRIDRSRLASADRQAGTTLILALVLLLLATLLGVFAMNVGIFAQRTSAADLRSRVIHQTLEGALAQGIEYIRNNQTTVISTMLNKTCLASDTTFPCGTVPACAAGSFSSGTTCSDATLARRGNMYYYYNSSGPGYDVNGNGGSPDALDQASLPIGTELETTAGNGFTVNYGVGAVMCMVLKPTLVTDPTKCTLNPALAQGTYLFTVTAVGNISGESAAGTTTANSTLSTSFGLAPSAPGAGKAATIIASGTVDMNGNGTFVTNQNGAGTGLALTVWTPQCVNTGGAGTVDTCYLEDWMRTANGVNGNSSYSFATNSDGSTSTVVTCSGNGNKTCSCSNTLSAGSGNLVEGIDILSNDSKGSCTGNDLPVSGTTGTGGCNGSTNCKANYDVDETEFPCDLFQFTFGTSAWDDKVVQSPGVQNAKCTEAVAGGEDCFCEYHKATTYTVANGSSQSMGVDEAFLYSKAAYIYDTNATREPTCATGWATSAQCVTSCATLASSAKFTGGILWDRTGSCLNSVSQIGYPDFPVILVEDGSAVLQGATMFGLVFVRDTTAPGTSTVYGGAASFRSNSTGTIYGSVVVQGPAAKLNGSSAVVYNGTVIANLLKEQALYSAAPVPGSWTDRYAY